MHVFKHVLAATDFSDASSQAIKLAVSIARDEGARLTLVNVCEVPHSAESVVLDLVTPLSDQAWTRLGELLHAVQDAVPSATRVLKVGTAWEQVLAAAEDVKADLIVMGTHGRRGVAHAIMGSVAERVVRLSPIPVLTVRAPSAG